MSLDELAYVKHMLDEARYLEGAAATLERNAFLADPTLQRAFVRSLEIVGEAAKHVSESFRARNGSIPWRAMAGMRAFMIHDYLGVDYEIVWDVVKNKVPVPRIGLRQIARLDPLSGSPDLRIADGDFTLSNAVLRRGFLALHELNEYPGLAPTKPQVKPD